MYRTLFSLNEKKVIKTKRYYLFPFVTYIKLKKIIRERIEKAFRN